MPLDALYDGVVLCGAGGGVISASPRALSIFGYPPCRAKR